MIFDPNQTLAVNFSCGFAEAIEGKSSDDVKNVRAEVLKDYPGANIDANGKIIFSDGSKVSLQIKYWADTSPK